MRPELRLAFRLLFAAFAASAVLLAGTAARADDPDALRGQAGALERENARLDDTAHGALLELYALETKLGRATRHAARLRERLDALVRERASASRQLRIARQAEAAAQKRLGDRLVALYVEGNVDPLEVLLGASSLDDAITALDNIARLAREDDRISRQAEETRAELRRAVDRLAAREREVREASSVAESARAALAVARDEKAAYLAALEREQALNTQEIQRLGAQAAAAEQRTAELEPAAPAQSESAGSGAAALTVAGDPGMPRPGGQLTVDAVAYSLPVFTASGLPVGKGVVAVDPSVIPLGTRMFVPGYGPAIAADVGTAIKGLIIDLWFPTYEQAVAWGRRTVTITISG